MERRHQVRRPTGATGGVPGARANQRRWPPGGVPGLGHEAGTVCDARRRLCGVVKLLFIVLYVLFL